MGAKRRKRRKKHASHWSRTTIISIVLFALLVGLMSWGLLVRKRQSIADMSIKGGLPTPIGFPDTAQDVNTMVGQSAPDFILQDETGQPVAVLPGKTERPIVLIFNMGLGWQLCVQQLGELQQSVLNLEEQADVYTINRDPPAQALQVRQTSRSTLPILYDANLEVATQYDFLPKSGQPMGGMSGIPQMGFVIIDANGIIRTQRVDIYYGEHVGQILEILESL